VLSPHPCLLNTAAVASHIAGLITESHEYWDTALGMLGDNQNDVHMASRILHNKGLAHAKECKYPTAIQYLEQALQIHSDPQTESLVQVMRHMNHSGSYNKTTMCCWI